MTKTMKPSSLPERKNNFKKLVDKIQSSGLEKTEKSLLSLNEEISMEQLNDDLIDNPHIWNELQNRCGSEFQDKLVLLEDIRQRKLDKPPFTWICTPRYGYPKAVG